MSYRKKSIIKNKYLIIRNSGNREINNKEGRLVSLLDSVASLVAALHIDQGVPSSIFSSDKLFQAVNRLCFNVISPCSLLCFLRRRILLSVDNSPGVSPQLGPYCYMWSKETSSFGIAINGIKENFRTI